MTVLVAATLIVARRLAILRIALVTFVIDIDAAAIGTLPAAAILALVAAAIRCTAAICSAVLPPKSAQRRFALDRETGRCERTFKARGESVANA